MSNNSSNRLFQHPGLFVLEKALIREGRLQLVAAVALSLLGLLLALLLQDKLPLLRAGAWAAFLIGLILLYRILLFNKIEQHRLVQLLKNQPQEIVWIYSVVTQRMPFGFHFSQTGILYFKLRDGDEISLELPAQQLKLVSKTLNRLLPHATFGYSEDRAQWFRANPELLLRKNKE